MTDLTDEIVKFTWDNRVAIKNFPFSEKTVVTLHKDHALQLADAIDAHYRRVRPEPDWVGRCFVCISIKGGYRYRLYDSHDSAVAGMREMERVFSAGHSLECELMRDNRVTIPAIRTVIFPRSVLEMYIVRPKEE